MVRAVVAACLLLGALAGCGEPVPEAAPHAVDLPGGDDVHATATTGVIRGVVVDDAVQPVAAARVVAHPASLEATTDAQGAFAFGGLAPGVHFLTVSKAGHTTIQRTVQVAAGVDDAEAVVVVLPRDEGAAPDVQTHLFRAHMSLSTSAGGGPILVATGDVLAENSTFETRYDLEGRATWVQHELMWEADPSSAERMYLECSSRTADGEEVVTNITSGPSVLVNVLRGDALPSVAVDVGCLMFVNDTAAAPVGLAVNQRLELYTTVFYNMEPVPGWLFTRDGEHPLP